MSLNNQFFFSAPIEVVKISSSNLEEAAEWCGGTIHETESRRVEGRIDKYILVPTPKTNTQSWAFPGMYITKRIVVTEKNTLKATFSVFRRDYFEKNFFDTIKEAVDKTWERAETEKMEASLIKSDMEQAMARALENKSMPEQRMDAREEIVEAESVVPVDTQVSDPRP